MSHPFDVAAARDSTTRAHADMCAYDVAYAEYVAAVSSPSASGGAAASLKKRRKSKKKPKKPKNPPNPSKNKRHKQTVDVALCAVALETIAEVARRFSEQPLAYSLRALRERPLHAPPCPPS